MSDPRMRGFARRSDVDDVEALLVERVASPLPAESLSTTEAAGRALASAVTSPIDLPPFDRSAMDGYAVRGEDTFGAADYSPISLKVVGESLPGRACTAVVEAGCAVRVMTGAPMPGGADAVLKVEETRAIDDGSTIEVTTPVAPQKNVSRRGEDVVAGTLLLDEGRVLRPQDIAVALAAGVAAIEVRRRPYVRVVTTGNELLPPGDVPRDAQIVDTNGTMVAALVARDGGTTELRERIPDEPEAIRGTLGDLGGVDDCVDAIVICGGSSVGAEDHVPAVVRELGELPIHGIAMRPSSPTGIGFVEGRPVFLLPGNPVSCLCAYDFFTGPTLRFLGGRSRAWPYRTAELRLRRKITSAGGRVDYARVIVKDGAVEPLAVSGASILSSAVRADGVVIVPRDAEGIPEGETVTVHLYGETVS